MNKKVVQSLLFSSNPALGNIQVSDNGSTFVVSLEEPLSIPQKSENVTLEVQSADTWNIVPNIVENQNKFYCSALDVTDTPTAYVLTIPVGLYDLTSLSVAIETALLNDGAKPGNFTFIADSATQKVNIRFNNPNTTIDFNPNDTFRDVLGFDPQVVGPFVTIPTTVPADNVAKFNNVSFFLISSDLVDYGLRVNNLYRQIICKIPITAKPGSQITYNPFNATIIDMNNLKGVKRTQIRFQLLDDSGNTVDTRGEYFSVLLKISYDM